MIRTGHHFLKNGTVESTVIEVTGSTTCEKVKESTDAMGPELSDEYTGPACGDPNTVTEHTTPGG